MTTITTFNTNASFERLCSLIEYNTDSDHITIIRNTSADFNNYLHELYSHYKFTINDIYIHDDALDVKTIDFAQNAIHARNIIIACHKDSKLYIKSKISLLYDYQRQRFRDDITYILQRFEEVTMKDLCTNIHKISNIRRKCKSINDLHSCNA